MKTFLSVILFAFGASNAFAVPCANGIVQGLDPLTDKLIGPLTCAGSGGAAINPWTLEDDSMGHAVDTTITSTSPGYVYGHWWRDTGIGDAGWISSVSAHIIAHGTNYAVGDQFTVDGGSPLGRCYVDTLSGSTVASYHCDRLGTGYTTGTKTTTAVTGAGSGLTLSIVTNEGTVTITAGSPMTIVGAGTHFLQLNGGAPGTPSTSPVIAVVQTGTDGTLQYPRIQISHVTDDTHAETLQSYPTTPVGTMADCSLGCTGTFGWSIDNWPSAYSYLDSAPNYYYDTGLAVEKRCLEDGDAGHCTGAANIAQDEWDNPRLNHGNQYLFDSSKSATFRADTFGSLVLRALNGHSEMWPGLRQMCTQAQVAFTSGLWIDTGSTYDLREEFYASLRLTWCAAKDPDPTQQAIWLAALVTASTNVWTPFEYSRGGLWAGMGAIEGSGVGTVSANIGMTGNPLFAGARLYATVHLVNGSSTMTLNSGTWPSGLFTGIGAGSTPTSASCGPRAQHYNGGCLAVIANPANATAFPTSNAAFVNDYWSVAYVDGTHATLDHNWTGAAGDYGWIYDSPQVAYVTQPPFAAIFGAVAEMTSSVFLAAGDPANASIWQGYNDDVTAWLANTPLASGGGAYSFGGPGVCSVAPVPQTSMCAFEAGVYFADSELTYEAIRALGLNYIRTHSAPVKALADLFMDGIFCKTGDCGRTPPANYDTNWDWPAGFNYVIPLGSPSQPKNTGQAFGVVGVDAWPASRASVPIAPAFTSTCPLTSGQAGVAYSQTVTATGDMPITFTIASGSLPTGLSLATSGAITGTPTVAVTASFTILASNGVSPDATLPTMGNCNIVIAAASGGFISGGKYSSGGKIQH